MENETAADDLLTSRQVAELIGVSPETVRRWGRANRIRHVAMPSGQRRYRRSDVMAVLAPVEPSEPMKAPS